MPDRSSKRPPTAAKAVPFWQRRCSFPGPLLGKDGAVAPSERITLAAMGIRSRGSEDLRCFFEEPVVQFVAIADIRKDHRESVKQRGEKKYGPGRVNLRPTRLSGWVGGEIDLV